MSPTALKEGDLIWSPSPHRVSHTRLARYMEWIASTTGRRMEDYADLWRWSVSDPEGFWSSIWLHFDVKSSSHYERALTGGMRAPKWFEGCQLNYAEHLLRHELHAPVEVALLYRSEDQELAGLTWSELGAQVRTVATRLRELGIKPGDRVAAVMPNAPETVIAMIACVAVGAVWAAAAPEFGPKTVIDRFSQIAPTMLLAASGYVFGGRVFDRSTEVTQIAKALPTLKHIVWLQRTAESEMPPTAGVHSDGNVTAQWTNWASLLAGPAGKAADFQFTRVPWDHPLWILFSSGTTGPPKAIVHGHAGMLLEHLKLVNLHLDLRPSARLFFHTTTGWMMWNVAVAGLLAGATIVLYDGSPTHTSPDLLWRIAADAKATHMGMSPTLMTMQKSAGIRPIEKHALDGLEMITVSGSPCSPELFEWIHACVKSDVWVASQSGGTEIASAFVGAVPTLPVYAGEIQARMLGMDVHSWSDAGVELTDAVGELVVTSPFPSMPLYFWNDPDGARYRDSYFGVFPGVWRHGDFIKINRRGGSFIYGRSDSTLNRHGVRIGTAEIYRILEQISEVADSLIVCHERPDGSTFMPLFVQLRPGIALDSTLRDAIRKKLRSEGSPRHIPDAIEQVEAIPYTLTGKKMEIPVRRILNGAAVELAASRDAMANPRSLDDFVAYRDAQAPAAPAQG
ncbi:MAG: acetoacetate--CoA ligase [Gammaproteobacteria bacterium]|nr:acetoacetate--CoA ligase [Gammaproteobacteria bacterium]